MTLTTLADGRTIGTPQDGNRGRVAQIALGRGDIVPTYDVTTGRVTSVSAPGGVAYDVVMGGDYLYEMTWRRSTGSTVAETLVPRSTIAFTYDVAGRVSTMGTRSAGATSNAVMAAYGYDNDDLLASVTTGANTLSVVRNQAGVPTSLSVGGSWWYLGIDVWSR